MEEKDSFFLQSLARLSRALFCQVDSQDILDGALFFDDISFQTAADYMMLDPDTSLRYSRMECRKTAEFAADFVCERRDVCQPFQFWSCWQNCCFGRMNRWSAGMSS